MTDERGLSRLEDDGIEHEAERLRDIVRQQRLHVLLQMLLWIDLKEEGESGKAKREGNVSACVKLRSAAVHCCLPRVCLLSFACACCLF